MYTSTQASEGNKFVKPIQGDSAENRRGGFWRKSTSGGGKKRVRGRGDLHVLCIQKGRGNHKIGDGNDWGRKHSQEEWGQPKTFRSFCRRKGKVETKSEGRTELGTGAQRCKRKRG